MCNIYRQLGLITFQKKKSLTKNEAFEAKMLSQVLLFRYNFIISKQLWGETITNEN